jgi:DNA-binding NarL/FixJ family response regulator
LSEAIWAEGRALGIDGAIALARESARDATVHGSGGSVLTARQQEVAVLLARGLTNRQIAERLDITERTVAAHVEHILDKLGFASRHQVAVWAANNGQVAAQSSGGVGRLPIPQPD